MIVSIEGPDKAGKSTLIGELKRRLPPFVRYFQVQLYPALMPHMSLVAKLSLDHWESMYDPQKIYICDRSVFVSGPVYDAIYGREPLDISKWLPRVFVVYVKTPIDVLRARYAALGDKLFDSTNYETILIEYEKQLANYRHICVDGTKDPVLLAQEVKECLMKVCSEFDCRTASFTSALTMPKN